VQRLVAEFLNSVESAFLTLQVNMLKIFGQHDENTIQQMQDCLEAGGGHGVLCADGHKGYSQPVGGVIGYEGRISVSGVGFDIACGNMACRTDAKLLDIQPHIGRIMDDVGSQISFGIGRANDTPVDHELFDDEAWGIDVLRPMKQKAASQLGTVGSGNHYVDIFTDETDTVWFNTTK